MGRSVLTDLCNRMSPHTPHFSNYAIFHELTFSKYCFISFMENPMDKEPGGLLQAMGSHTLSGVTVLSSFKLLLANRCPGVGEAGYAQG